MHTDTLPQVRKWLARGPAAHCGALQCRDCAHSSQLKPGRRGL